MPTLPTPGKGAERDFLMWVGYCITTWAEVEEQLFQICWKCLHCPKEQAAIVYYRTPSLDARVSLTDELVKYILPKPERRSGGHDHVSVKAWKQIERKFRSLLPTRNRIAHHPLVRAEIPLGPGMLSGMHWHYIYTSDAEMLREKGEVPMPLHVGDLQAHHILTLGLKSEIENFLIMILIEHLPRSA
jgi:hypothetical protein